MNTQDIEAEIGELLFQLAGLPLAFQAAEFVKNIDADPLTKWHMQQTVLSGAQVAGSREAYSTIMAAMGRQGTEALQRQIAADNHEAVKLLEKISEKEPIEVIGLGNLPFS